MSDRWQDPLHLVYVTIPGGGADTYARQMARALRARGQRVTVLRLCLPGQSADGPSRDGGVHLEYAKVSDMHYYYGRVRDASPAVVRRLLPDATTVKWREAAIVVRRALRRIARRAGGIDLVETLEGAASPDMLEGIAPYSVKLHSSEADWRYFCDEDLRPVDRESVRGEARLLRHARLVHTPNAALADHAAAFYGYPRSRISVLPYPLDLDMFTPGTDSGPRSGPASSAGPASHSVLYVGRMDRRKGLETLMEAAGAILGADPAATIEVVGGETEEVTAAGLLARVPPALRPRVVFHGRVAHADLPAYYQRAAVCVVPSRWDNSPNTMYEAMGCGVPVVASRVGGIPELVADGETGLLVARDDAGALAAAVGALLADAERRARMGRAARAGGGLL